MSATLKIVKKTQSGCHDQVVFDRVLNDIDGYNTSFFTIF